MIRFHLPLRGLGDPELDRCEEHGIRLWLQGVLDCLLDFDWQVSDVLRVFPCVFVRDFLHHFVPALVLMFELQEIFLLNFEECALLTVALQSTLVCLVQENVFFTYQTVHFKDIQPALPWNVLDFRHFL